MFFRAHLFMKRKIQLNHLVKSQTYYFFDKNTDHLNWFENMLQNNLNVDSNFIIKCLIFPKINFMNLRLTECDKFDCYKNFEEVDVEQFEKFIRSQASTNNNLHLYFVRTLEYAKNIAHNICHE